MKYSYTLTSLAGIYLLLFNFSVQAMPIVTNTIGQEDIVNSGLTLKSNKYFPDRDFNHIKYYRYKMAIKKIKRGKGRNNKQLIIEDQIKFDAYNSAPLVMLAAPMIYPVPDSGEITPNPANAAVPEPSMFALMLLGLAGLGFRKIKIIKSVV